jgi:hypothetical protein
MRRNPVKKNVAGGRWDNRNGDYTQARCRWMRHFTDVCQDPQIAEGVRK